MPAADMMVTNAGGGDKSGSTWANAMAFSDLETDLEGFAEAGDRYFIRGNVTVSSNILSNQAGTAVAPYEIIGVKAGTTNEPPVTSDWAYTTDRPVMACGAQYFRTGNYSIIRNLIFTTTGIYAPYLDDGSLIENCKSTNTSVTADRVAIDIMQGTYARTVACEASCLKGWGVKRGSWTDVHKSYIHDCKVGISDLHSSSITGNVIESCLIGFGGTTAAAYSHNIIGNTFYNNSKGIDVNDPHSCVILNNIFEANIVGLEFTTENKNNYIDFNVWDNGTDTVNATKGAHAITADPALDTTLTTAADGTTEAGDETDFRSAGSTFQADGVSTADHLVIHSGTAITAGVYNIIAIVNETTLTIGAGATTGGSSATFGIVTNEDFRSGSGSNVRDAALDAGDRTGVTVGT